MRVALPNRARTTLRNSQPTQTVMIQHWTAAGGGAAGGASPTLAYPVATSRRNETPSLQSLRSHAHVCEKTNPRLQLFCQLKPAFAQYRATAVSSTLRYPTPVASFEPLCQHHGFAENVARPLFSPSETIRFKTLGSFSTKTLLFSFLCAGEGDYRHDMT